MSADNVDRVEVHHIDGRRTTFRSLQTLIIATSRTPIEVTKGPTLSDPGDIERKYIAGPELVVLEVTALDVSEDTDAIEWHADRVELVWSRVGDQGQDAHQMQPLDVSPAINMEELRRIIGEQVQVALASDTWVVEIKLSVDLKGGPWKELPFGYGHIRYQPKPPAEFH